MFNIGFPTVQNNKDLNIIKNKNSKVLQRTALDLDNRCGCGITRQNDMSSTNMSSRSKNSKDLKSKIKG